MPGDPKFKKFEEWQKKATVYYNSFKNAKVPQYFLSFAVHSRTNVNMLHF